MFRYSLLLAASLSLACLTVFVCLARPHAQSADLLPGPVPAKFKTACLECHDAGIIVQQRLNKAAWTKELDKMIKWGAVVDPGDRDAFIEYLATEFPADKEPYAAPRTAFKKTKHDR
jgi:hypothetical protein